MRIGAISERRSFWRPTVRRGARPVDDPTPGRVQLRGRLRGWRASRRCLVGTRADAYLALERMPIRSGCLLGTRTDADSALERMPTGGCGAIPPRPGLRHLYAESLSHPLK